MTSAFAQTEAEIKVKAEQLFEKEQYVEATTLFLRLLSLQPRDFDYNYKYGTCLLFNSNKKSNAVRYLQYAVTGETIDPNAFFFLGKAYHLNFQFNDAIREYMNYELKAGEKGKYIQEAERNSVMCRNGKLLLTNIDDIVVTKKTEIKETDFFRIYDLSNIGGSFVVAADFQSKNDKKRGHIPLVHFPIGTDKIVYSSYGEELQKDLYMVRRLPDGKFSPPQKIQGEVNTEFEEDYPYLHPNGKYLYFSSKGHNSMGGFDVFRSKYDEENNVFLRPENVDFAISSPDDDILYVVDKDDKNAYFASARQSENGKLYVYEVKVDRVPLQLAIIKGSFRSTINPDNQSMKIEVVDLASNATVGKFATAKDGSYLLTLPKGGKYEYRVQVEGSSEIFKSQVEIPTLKEVKPLKQNMVHESKDGTETIRVVNLFNSEVDDAQAVIAQVLKDRSDLNVNTDLYNVNRLEQQKEIMGLFSGLGFDDLSITLVSQLIQGKVSKFQREGTVETQYSKAANAMSLVLVNDIKKLDEQIKKNVRDADATTSDLAKYSFLKEASKLVEERNSKLTDIGTLKTLGVKAGNNSLTDKDKSVLTELSKNVISALKSGNENLAFDQILKEKKLVKEVFQVSAADYEEQMEGKLLKMDDEIKKISDLEKALNSQIEVLNSEIAALETQKNDAREKDKPDFESKIAYKKEQLKEFENQRGFELIKQKGLVDKKQTLESEASKLSQVKNYSGSGITDDELEKAKSGLNTANMNSLAQYVSGQMAELRQANPNLDNSMANLNESDRYYENYKAEANKIKTNNALSEFEKEDAIIKLNNQVIAQLEKRFDEIKAAQVSDRYNEQLLAEQNSNDANTQKLYTQIKQIATDRLLASNNANSATENPIIENKQPIENRQATETQVTVATKESIAELVNPSFISNIQKINDLEISDLDKQKALQQEYKVYQTKLEAEKTKKSAELAKDPNNKSLQQEVALLSELVAENKTNLANVDSALAFAEKDSAAKVQTVEPIVENKVRAATKESITESINPDFKANIHKINSSLNTEVEKQQALKQVRDQFQAQLEAERVKKTELMGQDDTNVTAKNELALVDELITENQKQLADLNEALAIVEKNNALLASKEDPVVENKVQVSEVKNKTLSSEDLIQKVDGDYFAEMQKIEDSEKGSEKYASKMKREQEFQSRIEKQIAINQSELNTTSNKTQLQQELDQLSVLFMESINKNNSNYAQFEELKEIENKVVEPEFNTTTYISQLRKSLLKENGLVLTSLDSQTENLQDQDVILGSYLYELEKLKSEVESGTNTSKSEEIVSIESEISLAKQKQVEVRDAIEANQIVSKTELVAKTEIENVIESSTKTEELTETVDENKTEPSNTTEALNNSEVQTNTELSNSVAAKTEIVNNTESSNTPQSEVPISNSEIEVLIENEKRLAKQLSSIDLTDKERKDKQKELNLATNVRTKAQNAVLENTITSNRVEIERAIESTENEDLKNQLELSIEKSTKLKSKADQEKSELAKNYLLAEVEEEQEKTIQRYQQTETTLRQKDIESRYAINSLNSKSELETRKRSILVEIGEVETQLAQKSKEEAMQGQTSGLTKELTVLKGQQVQLNSELQQIDAQLTSLTERQSSFDVASKNKTVSFQQEFEIASTPEYEVYAVTALKVIELDDQLANLDRKKADAKAEINRLIAQEVRTGTLNDIEIEDEVMNIRKSNAQIGDLETQQQRNKAKLKELAPKDAESLSIYENLVLRGVNPIQKGNVAVDLVKFPSTGIEIQNAAAPKVERKTPIAMELDAPSGLVYRVQVGAFSKPIPDELFKEFTPVSGELIPNTSVIRYMAGYFNSAASVVEARGKIQNLGYSDAFVVAYCDGRRLNLSEARELEKSGQCIAKGTDEIMIEVAEMTAQKLGLIDSVALAKPVSEYQYTQIAGAAKATPIETVSGLFFTVQVGVFNKPVMNGELQNLEPLMTLRLPNGQIRYSTGVYNSLEEAKENVPNAVQKGVPDAFVTAYYNGTRISGSEGLALIEKQGKGILADVSKVENKNPIAVDKQIELAKPIAVFSETENVEVKNPINYQWISNTSYTNYPQDELSSYSRIGSFYFDQEDGKIKSKFYSNATDLLKNFNDKFVKIPLKNNVVGTDSDLKTVKIISSSEDLKGDFADWFIRLNNRSQLLKTDNGLEIRIFDIEANKVQSLKSEISIFGLSAEFVD